MRKNVVKKSIKAVSKKAVKNPTATVAITATVTGFGIFGVIETGIIIKNKAKTKLDELKEKKEQEKGKKDKENEKKNTEEEKKENDKKTEEEKNNENNEEAAA